MKTVEISPLAEIAMRGLGAEDVRQVQAWFDQLRNWDGDGEVRNRSVLLDAVPGVYFLRTTSDIRIFFRMDGDTVTVLDVARAPAILASGGIGITGTAAVEVVRNPSPRGD